MVASLFNRSGKFQKNWIFRVLKVLSVGVFNLVAIVLYALVQVFSICHFDFNGGFYLASNAGAIVFLESGFHSYIMPP